eukprot:TRINITY_DN1780_c1_g1_i1.p1 TRINITY_DN1780_c1_g1~~TRINITY_DN1780_c1_g1_i1.p1  ORF type:complete len:479 (+),score=179.61 TRINITY_DN1780_c1_g1_i1:76-1512(+)
MPRDIQGSGAFNTGNGAIYKPPEFFDSGYYKTGDIDKWHGQHRLVAQGGYKRLKKMEEGVLLVRFEMPFDVWCDKCGQLVAMGVRFNDAEKVHVGRYFSTPIYNFVIRHHCGNHITLQNDPKHITFKVTGGGKAKALPKDHADAPARSGDRYAETRLEDDERAKLRADPIAMAMHRKKDRETGVRVGAAIAQRLKEKHEAHATSGGVHALLLRQHKSKHGLYLHNSAREKAEIARYGVALLPETAQDVVEAQLALENAKGGAKGAKKPGATLAERVALMREQEQQRQQDAVARHKRKRTEQREHAAVAASVDDVPALDYHVTFHRVNASGDLLDDGSAEGDEEDEEDEGLPPAAPPILYNIPSTATPRDLSKVLSVVLGEALPRPFAFAVSQTHHPLAAALRLQGGEPLRACCGRSTQLHPEEALHLTFRYGEVEEVEEAEAAPSGDAPPPPAKRPKRIRGRQPKEPKGLPGLGMYGA